VRAEVQEADHQMAAVEAVLEAALSQDGAAEPGVSPQENA